MCIRDSVIPEEYCKNYKDKEGINGRLVPYLGMVENIDTNFGKLLAKLKEWEIEENTLVIYIGTDNGGGRSRKIFDSGLRGGKNSPYQGGTLTPVFIRWPAGQVPAGATCDAMTAHVDLIPTLMKITGAKSTPELENQLEGRSLLPLLKDPAAEWADRMLVHHCGRWNGNAEAAKYAKCSIQNSRFTLVNNTELYDLQADSGEKKNVIDQHPEVAEKLSKAYDQWWQDVQPRFVNKDAIGPAINPFQEIYYKQFGGSPTPADAAKMSRHLKSSAKEGKKQTPRNKKKKRAIIPRSP